jgi:ATP-dependent helicase HrpB
VELPSGRSFALDYEAALAASGAESLASPSLEARVEEFFGLTEGPKVAGRPLSLVLLSPARRPLQITSDLSGFWAGAWREVRKELRGRYPKHDWPEDPARASPPARRSP